MDVTSAFSFGLGKGTNFIQNENDKDSLGDFKVSIQRLLFITEIPVVAYVLGMCGIHFMSKDHREMSIEFEKEVHWECKAAKEGMDLKEGPEPDGRTVYAQFWRALEADPSIREKDIDTIIAAEMWDHLQAGHEGPVSRRPAQNFIFGDRDEFNPSRSILTFSGNNSITPDV